MGLFDKFSKKKKEVNEEIEQPREQAGSDDFMEVPPEELNKMQKKSDEDIRSAYEGLRRPRVARYPAP